MADEDFGIKIKVDPTSATPAIAGLKKQLDDLEAKGPSVGKAIGAGFTSTAQALRQASAAAEKTTREFKGVADSIRAEKLDAAARAFAGLAAQMEREASVLDRIRGPQKRYMEDLQALDGLLHRQLISTQEYAEQVTALNSAIEKTPRVASGGGSSSHISGMASGVRSLLAQQTGSATTLFSSGSIATAALAGGAAAAIHLGDSYIQLQNQAMRLTSSLSQVDSVLNEQMALSKQLHSSLSDTIQLSATMKEHVAELGLSESQTARFTKEWGEAVSLSNHSLGEAGSDFERFSTALQSGMAGGRGLRMVLTEFPQILSALEQHFHTTEAGIFALGKAGKLSMADVVQALDEAGTTLDQQMNQRVETAGQQWQHFKDQLTLSVGKLVESTGVIRDLGSAFSTLGGAVNDAVNALNQLHDLTGGGSSSGGSTNPLDSKFLSGGAGGTLGPLAVWSALIDHTKDENEQLKNVHLSFDQMQKDMENGGMLAVMRDAQEQAKRAAENTKTWAQYMDDLNAKIGSISASRVHEIDDVLVDSATAADHFAGAIGVALNNAMLDLHSGGIAKLMKDLPTLTDEWAAHDEALKKTHEGISEETKYLQQLEAPLAQIVQHEKMLGDLYAEGRVNVHLYRQEIERLTEAYEKAKQEGAIKELNGFERSTGLGAAARDIGETVVGAFRSGATSTYRGLHDVLTAKPDKTDKGAAQQIRDQQEALRKYQEQAKSTAESVVQAFGPVNEAIVKGIFEGKAGFADMARSVLENLAEMTLKALEFKAVMAVIGSGGTPLDAVPGLGSFAHAIGFAQGGSFTIPAAAQGLSGTFGGIGRTDSQIAAFRVTPGEHFTIQTPAQRAASERASGPMAVKVINVGDHKQAALEAMASDEGEQVVLNTLSRNPGFVRGLVDQR